MMQGSDASTQQLLQELVELRQQVADLQANVDPVQCIQNRVGSDLDTIFTHFSVPLAVFNSDKNCIAATPAFRQRVSTCDASLSGQTITDIFTENPDGLNEMLNRCYAGKTACWEEASTREKGATSEVRKWIMYPWYVQENTLGGIIMYCEDSHARIENSLGDSASKEFLQNVFKTMMDGVLITDSSGTITEVNASLERMLQFSGDELRGKHVAEMVHDEAKDTQYQTKVTQWLEQVFMQGAVEGFESLWKCKDGSACQVEVNTTLLHDVDNRITGAVACVRDMRARKEAQEQTHKISDFLKTIVESSIDGIVVTDSKGYIMRTNKAFQNLVGFPAEDLAGLRIFDLSVSGEGTFETADGELIHVNRKVLDDAEMMVADLFEHRKALNWESLYVRKDGKVVPVEQNATLIGENEHEFAGAVAIIRDVSERSRAQRDIRASRDFFESIIDNSQDGIVITDDWGLVIACNSALVKMSGFSKQELIGQHIFSISSEDEHVKNIHHENLDVLFEKGVTSYEWFLKTKFGKTIHVESNASLILDERNNWTAIVNIIRDVSERKKVEQQLFQTEKLKSLGELAGGVAHDFNNVLAAILGRAQLLRGCVADVGSVEAIEKNIRELEKGLEIIEKAAEDGAETVRRIQGFSRSCDDDKFFVDVDVNKILDDAVEFTRVRWKNEAESEGRQISLQRDFAELPGTLGSASELREVFTNIISNAIDAIGAKGVISVATSMKDSGTIVVNVKDNGIGIPQHITGRIFDPFFTTKGVRSTGLGMSVSYGIIKRHKGSIGVESVEGEGSVFTVELPVLQGAAGKEEKKPDALSSKQVRVLVIEDEPDVRELISDILTMHGHSVVLASGGREGLQKFETQDFDMVFTDLGMPEISGWRVAEEVKKINGDVPVMLITGWKVDISEEDMQQRGVDFILSKPFRTENIKELVQKGIELVRKKVSVRQTGEGAA